jgi:two-component system, LuxR family, sensor kinase FixL
VTRGSSVMPARSESKQRMDSITRLTLIGLLVGVGYYIGAMVGFALTLSTHPVSTLWPPNAILLAVLLLQPRQRYWLVLLGAFPAHLAIQLQSGVPPPMILCWFISNTSEALIGTFFLRRYITGPVDFSSLRCVLLYVVFAALLAPFLSSFLDAGFVSLVGWKQQSYWQVWLTRFPSNVLAELTIPPVILLWASNGVGWLRASWRRYFEVLFVMGGLIVVSLLVFSWHTAGTKTTPALLYLPLPFLLWAAMRFGAAGASTALLIVVLGSIFGAVTGGGPFVSASPADNVFSLQMFLLAISLPILFLAGLVEEQREKSKILSESEARFRSMADTAPVLIWMSDVDKRFNFFNKAWLDLTGRTLNQELDNGWAEGLHPEDSHRFFEKYGTSFNAREEFSMEHRLRRYNGEYCWILNNGTPRFESDGAFLGYIGSAIDVTQRKEAETQLRRQREEMAHMTRISTMNELAASLAHELNQPLTAILANAHAAERLMAAKPPDLEEVGAILKDIVKDNNRAGEIIWRMRALARRENLEFARVDLPTVVKDVILLLHSDAILHNVRIRLDLGPGLAPVRGDRVQLQQVVLNLLLNAFDAMKDFSAMEREIQLWIVAEGDVSLRLGVRDCGMGVGGKILDKIFEPFYTTKHNGLGMGLSISRSIVEAHGGRLWAECNDPEPGTTFYFTLPVVERDSEQSPVNGNE